MSHAGRIELGADVTVDVLRDAVGDHPRTLAEAFPGVPAAGWDAVRAAFPTTVGPDGRWRFPVNVGLVRSPGATVLIDAGVGPAGTAAARWLGVSGQLDADLGALGLRPDDIDVVVVTHLHQDHVGWLAAPGSTRPTFARARHVVSGREWSSAHESEPPAHVRDAFGPVQAADLLDLDGPLPAGLRLEPLPGHTPGHAGVLVERGDRRLLFAGDTFNHPLQLDEPDVPSLADADRGQASASRRTVLRRARDEALTVIGAHLPTAPQRDS